MLCSRWALCQAVWAVVSASQVDQCITETGEFSVETDELSLLNPLTELRSRKKPSWGLSGGTDSSEGRSSILFVDPRATQHHTVLSSVVAPSPSTSSRSCFFVTGTWADPVYRDRSLGVAQTWGRPEFVPPHARLLYLVGASGLDPFPGLPQHLIRNEQVVVFSADDDPAGLGYSELAKHTSHTITTVYSRFKDECDWFIMAEDDVYVNMSLVTSKLRCLDFHEPLYLGAVYSMPDNTSFVHGDLAVYSASGMAIFERALSFCSLPVGWGDVALADCLRSYQESLGPSALSGTHLQARWLVRAAHNNSQCELPDSCLSSAISLVAGTHQPECLDSIHKVVGAAAMMSVHELLQQRPPCAMRTIELLDSVDETLRSGALSRCGASG